MIATRIRSETAKINNCSSEQPAADTRFTWGQVRETAMHWRKVTGTANGKVFYIVVSALIAAVALTTTLLALHFHA